MLADSKLLIFSSGRRKTLSYGVFFKKTPSQMRRG